MLGCEAALRAIGEAIREGGVDSLLQKFTSKNFWPEGLKIFGNQKILEASWPQSIFA